MQTIFTCRDLPDLKTNFENDHLTYELKCMTKADFYQGKHAERLDEFYDLYFCIMAILDIVSCNSQVRPFLQRAYTFIASEPSALVQSLPLRGDNFEVAWILLVKRYDNKQFIMSHHIDANLQVPVDHLNFTAASMCYLLSTVNENVAALKALKLPVDQWDILLLNLLEKGVTVDLQKIWEFFVQDLEIPMLLMFPTFLERQCKSSEAVGGGEGEGSLISPTSSWVRANLPLVRGFKVSCVPQQVHILLLHPPFVWVKYVCPYTSRERIECTNFASTVYNYRAFPWEDNNATSGPFSQVLLSVTCGVVSYVLKPCGKDGPCFYPDMEVLPCLTRYTPSAPLQPEAWKHLSHLKADHNYSNPGCVDMLEYNLKAPPGTPVALDSVFGWILMGRVNNAQSFGEAATFFELRLHQMKL
ncbi:hypothetical protein PR048_003447 [Dryococelus australis]|uniref:Uncharacterized protein n=1 Tax=Dryococelus australis TaxID=614101 RepID=A0ABQ9INL1_9NEOP|nr:hypothetical protein PR048_003447 [Dryococelus australis]